MAAKAGAIVKLAVQNWPKIVAALGAVSVFLRDHPGVSTWARGQLDVVRNRVVAVQHRRGDAARIRGMLDIIRDVAREWDAHAGERSSTDAATWLRRADDIELGVRLAEAQPRPEQKKTLAGLRTDTDALLAALLEAMARDRATPPAGSSPAEPPEAGSPEAGTPAP